VNIVLFGPPGAGKGTQANNIANEYNLLKISTGDLLRKEIEEKFFEYGEKKFIEKYIGLIESLGKSKTDKLIKDQSGMGIL